MGDGKYIIDEDGDNVETPEDDIELERVPQAIHNLAAPKVKKGRNTTSARRDSNGDRIWKAIAFEYWGSVGIWILMAAISSTANDTRCAENFERRLRHSVETRIRQGSKVSRASHAHKVGLFCLRMASIHANMNSEDQVQFILRLMPLKQKVTSGSPNNNDHTLFHLPPPSSEGNLGYMGYYLMLVDEFARCYLMLILEKKKVVRSISVICFTAIASRKVY